jgi:hypothetical protein
MSKTLWHTIKLEFPKEMVNITKNDKVVVEKSLTKMFNEELIKRATEHAIKDTNIDTLIN